MPIYLCQPGTSSSEPWRHGIQVYERPFPLFQDDNASSSSAATTNRNNKEEGGTRGPEQVVVVVTPSSSSSDDDDNSQRVSQHDEKLAALQRYLSEYVINPDSNTTTRATTTTTTNQTKNRALIFCSNGTSTNIVKTLQQQQRQQSTKNNMTVLALGTDNTNVYNKINEFINNKSSEVSSSSSANYDIGGGGGCNVLVVEDDSEKYIQQTIISHNNNNTTRASSSSSSSSKDEALNIKMIINFDMPSSIDIYNTRLTTYCTTINNNNNVNINEDEYSNKLPLVVTFFDLYENTSTTDTNNRNNIKLANELVNVLKVHGQRVPRELIRLVQPPPLMSPSWNATVGGGGVVGEEERSGSGSGGVTGENRGRPRPLNAVPVREDSHSPAPPSNTTVGGGGGAAAARRQRQQQQQQERRFLSPSSNNSSDDDESSQNINNDTPGGSGVLQQQPQQSSLGSSNNVRPNPVRRIRHAEVVLVDQCLIMYGRTWLRLRWPGEHGGFGGFVALSRIEDMVRLQQHPPRRFKSEEGCCGEDEVDEEGESRTTTLEYAVEGGGTIQEIHHRTTTAMNPTSVPFGGGGGGGQQQQHQQSSTSTTMLAASTSIETPLLCQETSVHYPTSNDFMKLLPLYDDGLKGVILDNSNNSDDVPEGVTDDLLMGENGEPVFCRICREGIHDVNYDLETTSPQQQQQPVAAASAAMGTQPTTLQRERTAAAAAERIAAAATNNESSVTSALVSNNVMSAAAAGGGEIRRDSDSSISTTNQDVICRPVPTTNKNTIQSAATASLSTSQPSVLSHLANLPPIILHHPTAENPLLAPCDCTGTMRFVHYLCIEQWRCRSRHPGARNGLNCETCGAEYTLPPPPTRPVNRSDMGGPNNNPMAEEDWLDAMPPHVLAALRRPHPAWQLGAAVVRRRWLRPVVPILVSPLVALYCRARRTLKKRGVSRRRWACSLCRRRARWKCVRCLRSYYCSRQCQNVSWHIVHKHVCYKPVRFWWSVAVYTVGVFMAVPRLLENFPVYDAMVTLMPINFIALGVTFGGIASLLKRLSGIDIRGRILEIIVVSLTLFLTGVTSGLVLGYFGDASQCWGVFASSQHTAGGNIAGPFYPALLNKVLLDVPLTQIQLWYLKWDFIMSKLGFISRRFLCVPTADGNTDYSTIGCSPSTRTINPQFYLEGSCSADLSLVIVAWFAALGVLMMGNMYRQLRGVRRNNVVAAALRGRRRPHQD